LQPQPLPVCRAPTHTFGTSQGQQAGSLSDHCPKQISNSKKLKVLGINSPILPAKAVPSPCQEQRRGSSWGPVSGPQHSRSSNKWQVKDGEIPHV